MDEILKFIEYFEKKYPDLMPLENKSDFDRGVDAGMVMLLKEMRIEISNGKKKN